MPSKNKTYRPLSNRQKLFAAEVIRLNEDGKGGYEAQSLTQAALKAGYSPRAAKQWASRAMKNPQIRELIEQNRKKAEEIAVVDRAKVLRLVYDAVKKAMAGYPITNQNGEVIAVRIEPCCAPLLDILCKCTGSYAEEKIAHSVSADDGKFGIILNLEGKPKDDKAV